MICPLKDCECVNPPETAGYTEFAPHGNGGQFAYFRCRQTGALFVLMSQEAHQQVMQRLEDLESQRAKLLIDTHVEYNVGKQGGAG